MEGPGALLAKAREDHGYTQAEVATRLHLSPSIIRKLEDDDYDEQIPDAFARGYLRNYAKLVKLDQQVVIAKYSQMIGSSMVKNYYEPSTEVGSPHKGMQTLNQIMIWIVVLVIIIIITIWFMGRETESDAEPMVSSPQNSSTAPQTNENSAEVNSVPVQSVQDNRVTEQLNEDADSVTQSETSNEAQILDNETSANNPTEVPTGFQDTPEAVLDFDFSDDVWVQVTDANGEVLAVGLKTAGRRFQVSGMAPINVVLGKPRALNISYNDEPVDLSCFPAASTARFTLDSAVACNN